MTTLVTGGTGLVGGAIVRALVKGGQAVRVLARPTSRTKSLESIGVEIVRGDILDRSSLESALKGCETVYHTAAIYDFWVPDKALMLQTAIEGTHNVLDAALRANVRRVIYTSTAAVIGERRSEVGNEATRHRGYFVTTYERGKYEAEQIARSFVQAGLPLVIVNPAGVYGPGDLKPTGRSILNVLNGRVPLLFHAAISVVYVDDVALAHILAAERGRIGERYIVSERITPIAEWLGLACRLAGTRTPPMGPLLGAQALAEFGELTSRFTRRPPLISKDNFKFVAHGFRVDGSRAARELGLQYTPVEEGLRKALQWYWEAGLLKRKPICIARSKDGIELAGALATPLRP